MECRQYGLDPIRTATNEAGESFAVASGEAPPLLGPRENVLHVMKCAIPLAVKSPQMMSVGFGGNEYAAIKSGRHLVEFVIIAGFAGDDADIANACEQFLRDLQFADLPDRKDKGHNLPAPSAGGQETLLPAAAALLTCV